MFTYLHDKENSSGRFEAVAELPSLFISLPDPSLLHRPSELSTSALDGKISTSMRFITPPNQSLVCTYVPDGR